MLTNIKYAPLQDLSVSNRCEPLKEQTIDFCERVVRPHSAQVRAAAKMPPQLLNSLKSTGWLGMLIEKQYGGLGLDCLHRVINVEYLARECPDLGAILQIAQLGTGSIIEFGSEAQKRAWLPSLASGERICTISITEEHSGSHVLGMSTTYEHTKGGVILNGEKWFIGNCGISNLHVVYARAKDERHISGFIVDGTQPGIDNSEPHNQTGLKSFPLGKLKLDNVFVPEENILGTLGDGLRMAYYVIGHHGRPSLTGLALGIHHRILDLAYTFAMERQLYGKPISDLPDVRSKLFEIYTQYEQSRHVAYEAAHKMSIGENAYRPLSLAKYLSGEYACRSATSASEVFGARAGLQEFEIAQLSLDAMMTRPPSGTGDVQKKRIMDDIFSPKHHQVQDNTLQRGAA